ncbi:MAG: ribonuclease J [Dehalococcoidia bacterium]|nr:ribonuclease J [Dehalococcoidia bacterium]
MLRLRRRKRSGSDKLRIIPLGGLGEIGKNMMIMEFGEDMIVIDTGLMFPEEEMLGIDYVIPNINFLKQNKHKLKAIIITHGHEDHTGALPYILAELPVPVYATRLTQGFLSLKLKEHKLLNKTEVHTVQPGEKFTVGKFTVEFFSVCHSIPDAAGLIIETPVGTVVHSGDFKLDYTPVDGKGSKFSRLAELGSKGIMLLMSDSTYIEIPGYTPSETVVAENLDQIISGAPGRVIITTFASLVSRLQQVLYVASKHNRRVAVAGKSMTEVVKIAQALGYLKAPEGIFCRLDELPSMPLNKIIILTTGSQGEPTSALVRIANRDHKFIQIMQGDTVIISASTIPGNEALVNRTIDNLFRQGANVIYDKLTRVHVHGHGSQEELKLLISMVNPRYFMPIHGEYRHLVLHGRLARSLGVPENNVFILDNGAILELDRNSARIAGQVEAGNVYVDGISVGGVNNVILRDRQLLSRDGIVLIVVAVAKRGGHIVGEPDIMSMGFVDAREVEKMTDKWRQIVIKALSQDGDKPLEVGYIQVKLKEVLGKYFHQQTGRRPLILPVVMEV